MVSRGEKYHTYILFSPRLDNYYVGHSQNIEERINNYHNVGKAKYTKRGIPWRLVYSKAFDTRADAMKHEREIKLRKSRRFIEKLVQSVPSRS